jgi:hypothetical protein
MKFGTLLKALREKGRVSDAELYEKTVAESFLYSLTKQQVQDLDVDQIIIILNILKIVKASPTKLKQISPLQNYVADLQARGFSVSLGEKYRE